MTQKNSASALMNLVEASALIGKDPRTLKAWIEEDQCPGLGVRLSGRLWVRRHVLEKLVKGPTEKDDSERVPATMTA